MASELIVWLALLMAHFAGDSFTAGLSCGRHLAEEMVRFQGRTGCS